MYDDFTISLKAARINAELTVERASEEIGVSKQTILNWEMGKTDPSISQFKKMSDLYRIPLTHLRAPIKSQSI